MPTTVEIPGVGEVEFPDEMTPADIHAAAKRLHDQQVKPQGAVSLRAAENLKRIKAEQASVEEEEGKGYFSRLGRRVSTGAEAVAAPFRESAAEMGWPHALESDIQTPIERGLQALGGAASIVTAPFSAGTEAIARQLGVGEDVARSLGDITDIVAPVPIPGRAILRGALRKPAGAVKAEVKAAEAAKATDPLLGGPDWEAKPAVDISPTGTERRNAALRPIEEKEILLTRLRRNDSTVTDEELAKFPGLQRQEPSGKVPTEPPVSETFPAEKPTTLETPPAEVLSGPFENVVSRSVGKLDEAIGSLRDLDTRVRMALEHEATIAETGTLPKKQRIPYREAPEGKPETFEFQFSEKEIRDATDRLTSAAKEWKATSVTLKGMAEPASRNVATIVDSMLKGAVDDWTKLRFAAGRSVKQFDRLRKGVPPEVLHALEEAGHLVTGLKTAKLRAPIYTNIVESMQNWPRLNQIEKAQFRRDLVDAWRLNLFSVTSWTLDLVGNAAAIGAQVVEGAGRDAFNLVRGKPELASLQGFLRAVREKRLPTGAREELGRTVSGEILPGLSLKGAGTFTKRSNAASRVVDLAVGLPLYTKGIVDTTMKRFGANAVLWREAIEEASRQKLTGVAKQRFFDEFWANPPEAALKEAISWGKKAGFDRPLTAFEERVANSTFYRLFGAAFGRWPFQFTRSMAEWLGADPAIYRKIRAGTLKPEELTGHLTKAATGWGGLYLLNSLYDSVDFRSMEYVQEDGNRVRLSGREPLATGLWLLATMKGDLPRSTAALRYASIPFAGLVTGEGGLITGILKTVARTQEQAKYDAKGMQRELTDMVNRAIPGQALLAAVKTLFDPVTREGIGAKLPGVSQALPAAVNPTTGEPLEIRQRVLGAEIPAIGGVPIPGAARVVDPVAAMLSKYPEAGKFVYRGPRQPIASMPAAETPRELRREWEAAFGRQRARLLGPLAQKAPSMQREAVVAQIRRLDNVAARLATAEINRKYGHRKPPKGPTLQERTGPRKYLVGQDATAMQPLPPPNPHLRALVNARLDPSRRGLQSVAMNLARQYGVKRPVRVNIGPYPISKTLLGADGYEIQVAQDRAEPWSVLHEMQHIREQEGQKPETGHDNSEISAKYLLGGKDLDELLDEQPYEQGRFFLDLLDDVDQGKDPSYWMDLTEMPARDRKKLMDIATMPPMEARLSLLGPDQALTLYKAMPASEKGRHRRFVESSFQSVARLPKGERDRLSREYRQHVLGIG